MRRGNIPPATFFLMGHFTSRVIDLDAVGSINHLNFRQIKLAWSSFLQ